MLLSASPKSTYSDNDKPSSPSSSSSSSPTSETPTLPSSSREMRNRAEKIRRDRLNSYIGELATLVPLVSKSTKRLDKTSILRLTATHLRLYRMLLSDVTGKTQLQLPKQIDQRTLEEIVCDELGAFMVMVTVAGKIVFVSSTVEKLLGYPQTDLMGQSIYNVTSLADHEKLRTYLNSYGDLETRWRKYFSLSFRRSAPRTESNIYQTARVTSIHRPTSSGDDDILLLFVRMDRPAPITSKLLDASRDEYVTRHLVDGRIINCDHRISLVAGYMTDEVAGLSAFKFMHKDDVRWVIIALRQMYDKGETKGSSCYRLLSRNSRFIYLRTSGFLEVDDQGTVESFICINTLVDEKEGNQLIQEMKRRYSALVDAKSILPSNVESVEDPAQIERAVIDLIRDLPSTDDDDNTQKTTQQKTKKRRSETVDVNLTFKRHKAA